MNQQLNKSPAPELAGALSIPIGLDWFMDKFSSGLDPCVTVTKDYCDYLLKSIPSIADHLYFEYQVDTNLARIYRLSVWNNSIVRQRQRAEQARIDRERMLAEQVAHNTNLAKQAGFRGHLDQYLRTKFPNWYSKMPVQFLNLTIDGLINGDEVTAEFGKRINYDKIKSDWFNTP